MSKRMNIAFGCHLLATLNIAAGGVIYLFSTQFMPYHAIAVDKTWDQVDPSFQILLLALIRDVGGLLIAIALAMGILLFIPFRQCVRWARWAVPAVGLVAILTVLYPVLSVTLNTPANPPWISIVLIMVLLVAGFIFSLVPEKQDIV